MADSMVVNISSYLGVPLIFKYYVFGSYQLSVVLTHPLVGWETSQVSTSTEKASPV
jgi:hypothetical protein